VPGGKFQVGIQQKMTESASYAARVLKARAGREKEKSARPVRTSQRVVSVAGYDVIVDHASGLH
jgi:hypothetical protein